MEMMMCEALKLVESRKEIQLLSTSHTLLQQTLEYRQECQQSLNKQHQEMESKCKELEYQLRKEEKKMEELEWKEKEEELKSVKDALNESVNEKQTKVVEKQEDEIDELLTAIEILEQELNSMMNNNNSEQLDEAGLRCKIYRGLGFQLQKSSTNTTNTNTLNNNTLNNGQEWDRIRVRNASGDDVQTIELTSNSNSNNNNYLILANQLWDLSN